jgi:hypothetical protein
MYIRFRLASVGAGDGWHVYVTQQQWENQASPVYADAIRVARDVDMRGIKVECIRRSKDEGL